MREYCEDSLIRAGKTFAQSALALIGFEAVAVTSLDWVDIGSISVTAFIISILMSVVNLPVRGDSGSKERVVEADATGEEPAAPQRKAVEPEIS